VLLLAAAAGLGLGSAGLPPGEVVVGALVTALVASVTVILPLVAYLVLGQRAMPPLTRARDWLERNNAVVMAVVFAVLGVVVLLEGLTGL
jgi:cadmium resistance protein CadD (predicted permease)